MDDYSGIPKWLPPLLCLVTATSAGLTSFGDAILFQVIWAVLQAAEIIPSTRGALIVATLFTSLNTVSSLPLLLYQSRKELWASVPYGLVLGVFSAAAVPVGSRLLFFGDLSLLKISVGLFFLTFSVVKLSFSVKSFGRKRAQRNHVELADNNTNGGAKEKTDKSDDATIGMPASNFASTSSETAVVVPIPESRSVSSASVRSRSQSPKLGPWEAPSENNSATAVDFKLAHKLNYTVVIDESRFASSVISSKGLLQSSSRDFSVVSEPPSDGDASVKIVGFQADNSGVPVDQAREASASKATDGEAPIACLPAPAVGKDVLQPPAWVPEPLRPYLTLQRISHEAGIRATFAGLAVAGAAGGLLGAMFGTAGPPLMVAFALLKVEKDHMRAVSGVCSTLDIAARITAFIVADNTPFRQEDWLMYAVVPFAAGSGFMAGSYVRRWTDTDVIIAMLLVLVYTSSAILLGALHDSAVAATFGAGTALWAVLLGALFFRPHWFGPCWRRKARSDGAN